MNRKITIEYNGTEYTGELARITSTALGYEDHGIMTAWLTCEWPGGGISVGGYSLDKSVGGARVGTAYGLDHIMRLMDVVGVDTWEKLRGQQVIVLFEGPGGSGSIAAGIAGALNNKVLILKQHAQTWKDEA